MWNYNRLFLGTLGFHWSNHINTAVSFFMPLNYFPKNNLHFSTDIVSQFVRQFCHCVNILSYTSTSVYYLKWYSKLFILFCACVLSKALYRIIYEGKESFKCIYLNTRVVIVCINLKQILEMCVSLNYCKTVGKRWRYDYELYNYTGQQFIYFWMLKPCMASVFLSPTYLSQYDIDYIFQNKKRKYKKSPILNIKAVSSFLLEKLNKILISCSILANTCFSFNKWVSLSLQPSSSVKRH